MSSERPAEAAAKAPVSPDGLDHALRLVPPLAWLAWLGASALLVAVVLWSWFGTVPVEARGEGLLLSGSVRRVLAPDAGSIENIVGAGQDLRVGDAVATVRMPDGTLVPVPAVADATVIETYAERGWMVERGTPLANLEPSRQELRAIVFVPLQASLAVKPGMEVQLDVSGTSRDGRDGLLLGRVVEVSPFPASPQKLMALLENVKLAHRFEAGRPAREVTVALDRDPAHRDQYLWTTARAPSLRIAAGMQVEAHIVLKRERPLALVLSWLGR
jgi:HlyD family secretion protein